MPDEEDFTLETPAVVRALDSPGGFRDFFRTEYPRMVKALMGAHRASSADADDCVAHAMGELAERWDHVHHPRAYAMKIARRQLVNENKRRLQAVSLDEVAPVLAADDPALVRWESREFVANILEDLPEMQHQVMYLIAQGHTQTEIAEILCKKPNNVRQTVHHAKERLRPLLAPRQLTAVDLLAAVDSLPFDRPESWRHYRLLGPDLLSLLEITVKPVDREHFILLMEATGRMVRALYQSGPSQAGRVLCERALTHSAALGNTHPAVLRVRHYRAWAVADHGNLTEAEALFRNVLQGRLRLLDPEHPDVLRSRHELAWIAACRQDWTAAEKGYRSVLRNSVNVQDPDTLITRHELGWAIANQGRFDDAREVFQAVLADRMQVLGPQHQRTLATQHELAWITARQGNWADAETDYRGLLDLRRQTFGEDHPDTILTLHELAWIAARQGRTTDAKAGYADALNRRRRVLGEGHPQTRATWAALKAIQHGRIVDARHLA